MKKLILIITITILAFTSAKAQKPDDKNTKVSSTNLSFPDKCIGKWSGMMQIYYQGILRDSVKVIFTVSALNNQSWTWKTEYISEKMPLTKDYVLKKKNNTSAIFTLDEGEGVELMDYVFGNKLYAFFETEGIFLSSTYELIDEKLIFEVTSGKKQEKAQSQITNYTVDGVQRVVLKKMK